MAAGCNRGTFGGGAGGAIGWHRMAYSDAAGRADIFGSIQHCCQQASAFKGGCILLIATPAAAMSTLMCKTDVRTASGTGAPLLR